MEATPTKDLNLNPPFSLKTLHDAWNHKLSYLPKMLEVNSVASQEMLTVYVSARTLILVTGPGGTGMGGERWVRSVEWVVGYEAIMGMCVKRV